MKKMFFILAFGIAACSARPNGTADVELRVEPTTLQAGDTATLILRNNSSVTLGYNLCPTALERKDGEMWQAIPSERMCTMELRMLEPGQEASYRYGLPTDLVAGDYRFVTGVNRMPDGDGTGVASETVRITQ